ncbi:uncharacterized protein LOC123011231 [Tribolium madens]|uniref:uncharacterized protein LOC123011231 n=1 Tax=Tribolium madens TaxID=41895 RepID=UPI001CF74DBC|nr:uncharacterized protein LOC123011231 [Tribolium madens]
MSLKLVKLVFKFGSLLALTPTKIEINGLVFPSKAYALLWIILFGLLTLSISAFYRKASYEKFTPVILTIQVATDTVFFILNISTIIITATKRHHWNRFINILKFLKSSNEKGDLFWFLPFLLTNVVFVVIFTYYTYIGAQIMGVDFFKLYAVEYFQFYAQFIVYYLIYEFLNLILNGFNSLSKTMCKILKMRSNRLHKLSFKRLKSDFCALAECVEIFNNTFGWLLLLSMGFTTLEILRSMQYLISGKRKSVPIIIYRIMFITWHLIGTLNGVFICDLTEQRVKVMRMVAYQIVANFDGDREVEEIKKLINVINDNFPHFTAARYFDLNRKTILGVLNAFFTFLIVAIQFEDLYN